MALCRSEDMDTGKKRGSSVGSGLRAAMSRDFLRLDGRMSNVSLLPLLSSHPWPSPYADLGRSLHLFYRDPCISTPPRPLTALETSCKFAITQSRELRHRARQHSPQSVPSSRRIVPRHSLPKDPFGLTFRVLMGHNA